jgi:hypothetical protein
MKTGPEKSGRGREQAARALNLREEWSIAPERWLWKSRS